jgi:hypothetical protein
LRARRALWVEVKEIMSVQRTGGWMVAAILIGLITTAHAQPPGTTPTASSIPKHDDDAPPVRHALAPAPAPGPAQEPILAKDPQWRDRHVSFVMRLGYEHGGDDLLTIQKSDGSSFDLAAGNGVLIAAGLLFTPHPLFALELTAGYKSSTGSFSNGSLSLHRVPLEAIASFAPGNHRIGIGPALHTATRFDCKIDGICGGNIDFQTAIGVVLQWVYTAKNFELGARATLIHYRLAGDNAPNDTISGSNLGGFVGVRL